MFLRKAQRPLDGLSELGRGEVRAEDEVVVLQLGEHQPDDQPVVIHLEQEILETL